MGKVVNGVNVAIQMLTDLPAFVPILKIALPGLFPGAQKEHYGVVGQAALNSLAIALGRYWTEPVKNAWLKIWTTVVSVMFPEEEAKPAEVPDPSAEVEAQEIKVEENKQATKAQEDEAKKKALEDKKKAEAEKKKKKSPPKKKKKKKKKKKS